MTKIWYDTEIQRQFEQLQFKIKTIKVNPKSILKHKGTEDYNMNITTTLEDRIQKLEDDNNMLKTQLKNVKGVNVASGLGSVDSIGNTERRKKYGKSYGKKNADPQRLHFQNKQIKTHQKDLETHVKEKSSQWNKRKKN